jgi:sigma-B regulation protein RsbU (phosphoserine phosphatase)
LVGAFPNLTFTDSETGWSPGELLFMYTDGLTEARSASGELFGEERVMQLLHEQRDGAPSEIAQRVVDEAVAFANGKLVDDVAILALRRNRRDG